MKRQRYTITDKNGKSVIAEKEASRFISIDEFAQHIAMDIVDDYRNIKSGDKRLEETNIELSIKVLTAISPVIEAFQVTERITHRKLASQRFKKGMCLWKKKCRQHHSIAYQ